MKEPQCLVNRLSLRDENYDGFNAWSTVPVMASTFSSSSLFAISWSETGMPSTRSGSSTKSQQLSNANYFLFNSHALFMSLHQSLRGVWFTMALSLFLSANTPVGKETQL